MAKANKDELVYARVGAELKGKLAAEMSRRHEAEAVIVREALIQYFNYKPTSLEGAGAKLFGGLVVDWIKKNVRSKSNRRHVKKHNPKRKAKAKSQ